MILFYNYIHTVLPLIIFMIIQAYNYDFSHTENDGDKRINLKIKLTLMYYYHGQYVLSVYTFTDIVSETLIV